MSGETQVEVQIPLTHTTMGDHHMGKLSIPSSGLNSSGGSTGEDSGGEEPHHLVIPKKIRLKDPNLSIKAGSSLLSMICSSGGSREHLIDDPGQDGDDDYCSGPPTKDSGVSNSLTSGENSDAEGEDAIGSHCKSEDSSKKMFECDVCNMRFSNGANMRRHRMRHSGIKPFECKMCQKRFFRKDHLAEHMATHSKLLPFRCPICNKGFQRQIAMRAHFQNEHVGGSQDLVKTCPLCAYKAGSMKCLRGHFSKLHGIDLDNPMPNSPSLMCSAPNGRPASTPSGPSSNGAEYSELAHALGFEDRDKRNTSSIIPSHFLVPQIEITSNSPYPNHFGFNSDSNYSFQSQEDSRPHNTNGSATPNHTSPHSDGASTVPTSSDLINTVVKKEAEESHPDHGKRGTPKVKEFVNMNDDVQDMPEDLTLSSGNGNSPPKCSPSSSMTKFSPLKSLLREEWRPQDAAHGGGNSLTVPRDRSDSSSGHSSNSAYQNQQSCDGEAITSSNGTEAGNPQSVYARRGIAFPALHQCVYCGIIFPDKTLYFLHKGCHSELNPWRCNICGELCNDVYDFNSHLLSKSHQ